ncbi:dipeptidase 1-like isoform X1 [Bombus vosnesenskii]|uniref:Dipeptidase n=4 Tax=Pyrobombus TaxID=144703 RepID=A0A6J3L2U5_9HYME|nr:dipeptidase 1-like isoform X1 [Bombus vancouverensis nearcticus]XP_033304228.1 dipeptidase 1-like isoform X1 [Bombus bifarius]XP_033358781.1 dipeptidase 1-like isoform X1 [Bombus vosnesenskii]XP_050475462.1 dipeptidase 1-like isoform X1 [Bombus huntii]
MIFTEGRTQCTEGTSNRGKKIKMFELYGMNKDGMVYRSPPPRRKEVDILETCLQLSSPELMRKLPNGDAVHHTKDSVVSTSFDKNKDLPRENRRNVLRKWIVMIGFFFLGCALVAGVGLPLALELRSSHLLEARLQVVRRMLSEVPLIDGHNDFAWNLRKHRGNTKLKDFPFDENLSRNISWGSQWQTDLVRLRQGIVGGQFWSVYVPCEAQFLDAVQLTLEQIDVVRRLTSRYPKKIRMVTSSKELEKAHKDDVIGSLVGIEGGHSIGTSMAVLRSFHQLGARYMTLTHKCNTPWADSCSVEDSNSDARLDFHSDGLSVFGRAVVKELNRLGMLVDLSHVSVRTMRHALAMSKAPVIFSHSAARALCNSSSNVPDDILRNLSVNGGLVMVSFDSAHLSCGDKASMYDVIAHINHIRRIAGVNHVGLGAGYDGISNPPIELPDVSGYPLLLAELTRDRRWSALDIKKLVGGNLLRVLKEVENHATIMSHQSPAEELIPQELIEDTAYCRYQDA